MRKVYEDAMSRMQNVNPSVRRGFLSHVHITAGDIAEFYDGASTTDRKAFLMGANEQIGDMLKQGMWPQALATTVTCLNAESRFVAGEDAAYVRRETDRLIKEAQDAWEVR